MSPVNRPLYNKYCFYPQQICEKMCFKVWIKCFKKGNNAVELSHKNKNDDIKEDINSSNVDITIGEKSGAQISATTTHNEGKLHSINSEHITNGFAIDGNKPKNGENSYYSFTSKIQNKNDEIIAQQIAENEVYHNYATKGAEIQKTKQ